MTGRRDQKDLLIVRLQAPNPKPTRVESGGHKRSRRGLDTDRLNFRHSRTKGTTNAHEGRVQPLSGACFPLT